MDACTLAATLLHVGEHYNTSTADLRRLVQKLVTLSLRYVSRRDLWAELFGADEFVHWELVEKHAANANVLGDLSAWLALLGFRASQVVPTGIGALTGIDLVSESVATPSTKRITFKCRAAAGAGDTTPTATDPVSGSTLMLEITLQDTSAK